MDRLHRDIPNLWRRYRFWECRIRQRSRHLLVECRRAPVWAVLQAIAQVFRRQPRRDVFDGQGERRRSLLRARRQVQRASFNGGQRYTKRRCQFAAHSRNGVQSYDFDGAAGRSGLDLSPGRDAEPVRTELVEEQMRRFGDEVLMHHEYTKEKGRCRIGGLPLIRYTTEQRLNEIMRSFEADGCMLNNPHIFKLEDGGRFDPEGRKMAFRASVDPMKLLNPGKLRSLS